MSEKECSIFVNAIKNKIFRFSKGILVSTMQAEDSTQGVHIKLCKLRKRLDDFKQSRSFCDDSYKTHFLYRLKSSQAKKLRITHNNFQDRRAGFIATSD